MHHHPQQHPQQQQQHPHPHHTPSGTAPTSSEPAWFSQNLQPSTSIADGEQFVHLPAPFMNGPGPAQTAPANASTSVGNQSNGNGPADALQGGQTLPSPQISTKSGPARSRKKDKLRDDPQRLEDLRDPIPGSKPDYPYPVLIKCAILSHSKRSPTLSEIYEMIHGRFAFFKMDDASWKVRPCFSPAGRYEWPPQPSPPLPYFPLSKRGPSRSSAAPLSPSPRLPLCYNIHPLSPWHSLCVSDLVTVVSAAAACPHADHRALT